MSALERLERRDGSRPSDIMERGRLATMLADSAYARGLHRGRQLGRNAGFEDIDAALAQRDLESLA